MDRRLFLQTATLASLECLAPKLESYSQETGNKFEQVISIQTHTAKGPLPHVWEECVGSDRAAVAMRAQWLSDLELVKKTAGVKSVRFHGLFDDEVYGLRVRIPISSTSIQSSMQCSSAA